ncbi:MAG: DEAD/DEAH box helicase [Phycisphaerales bacterium]
MPFDALGLHPIVRRGIEMLGFAEPTPIQAALVPAVIDGKDAVGLAPTGTGKTLAYVLPIAHRLLADPPPLLRGPKKRGGKAAKRVDPRTRLRAIVLCPTRELAQQVAKDARALLRGSLLRTGAVWGKAPIGPQRELLETGIDFLAGTPGRVRELLEVEALSLAHVRHVVVDEADRMLDLGFAPQVEAILERAPPDRQTLFMSATFPPMLEELKSRFLRDPVRIESGEHSRPASHVAQTLYEVEDAYKTALVLALVTGEKRRGVLVFTRTRRRAGWVAQALRSHGVSTGLLHGDRSQPQREQALAEFAAGRTAALVATDIAARGLHIPAIRTVINYDVPLWPEEYVHRVGRAGHGGGFGESFTFVTSEADEVSRWKRIAKIAHVDLAATSLPDVGEWMRPEDRERFRRDTERVVRRKQAKADRDQERSIDAKLEAERDAKKRRPEERKKTTKRAGKPTRSGRGGGAKRVTSGEQPGTGVRRIAKT